MIFLPYDVLFYIFGFLDGFSKTMMKITNKENYNLLRNESSLRDYEINLKDLIANHIDITKN